MKKSDVSDLDFVAIQKAARLRVEFTDSSVAELSVMAYWAAPYFYERTSPEEGEEYADILEVYGTIVEPGQLAEECVERRDILLPHPTVRSVEIVKSHASTDGRATHPEVGYYFLTIDELFSKNS